VLLEGFVAALVLVDACRNLKLGERLELISGGGLFSLGTVWCAGVWGWGGEVKGLR